MTDIVVANRSGLAEGPDGAKYRLVRGRTLADGRHPLPKAHPDLFSDYVIDLPYDDEGGAPAAAERGDVSSWPEKVAEAEAVAKRYREQLAAIAEGLYSRGLVPDGVDTEHEGWLAELVFATIDEPAADPVEVPELLALPPRKRAPRRAAAPRPVTEAGDED